MIFPLCFSLPKFASGFFLFPTCSRILMITFFHSLPVFNFWIGFSIFFPFLGFGNEIIHFRTNFLKSFLLTPALAFNNQTGENQPCRKIDCIHIHNVSGVTCQIHCCPKIETGFNVNYSLRDVFNNPGPNADSICFDNHSWILMGIQVMKQHNSNKHGLIYNSLHSNLFWKPPFNHACSWVVWVHKKNVWTIKVVLEFWFGHSKCHFFWSENGHFWHTRKSFP